jgi:hypothetical protein
VGDVSPNRVALNLSSNSENVAASVDLDVDECVHPGIGVQDGVQSATLDGDLLRVESLAVDDGWNLAVATHAACGSASESGALESAQGLLLHDEGSSENVWGFPECRGTIRTKHMRESVESRK